MATTNETLTGDWQRVALTAGDYRLQGRNLRVGAAIELAETNAAGTAPADGIDGWLLSVDGETYKATAARFLWARVMRDAGTATVLSITPAS